MIALSEFDGDDGFDSADFKDGVVKAWMVVDTLSAFDLLDSYGITSVTDIAVGKMSFVMDHNSASTDLCVMASSSLLTSSGQVRVANVIYDSGVFNDSAIIHTITGASAAADADRLSVSVYHE